MKTLHAFALVAGVVGATAAQADTVDFDEFSVDCCYGAPGDTGPLAYPNVIIVDGAGAGDVMNGSGWANLQTSGDNLFGTLSGSMWLNFNSSASNVEFDIINGSGSSSYFLTATAYDLGGATLGAVVLDLASFPNSGAVGHASFGFGGIWQIGITGSPNFAIDTLSFDVGGGAVPEPASWALMIGGFAIAGAAMRRRAARVAYA